MIADRAKKSYSRGSFGRVGRVTGNKNFFFFGLSSVIGTTVVQIASDINKISCRFSNAVIDFKVMYKSSNFYVYFLYKIDCLLYKVTKSTWKIHRSWYS